MCGKQIYNNAAVKLSYKHGTGCYFILFYESPTPYKKPCKWLPTNFKNNKIFCLIASYPIIILKLPPKALNIPGLACSTHC